MPNKKTGILIIIAIIIIVAFIFISNETGIMIPCFFHKVTGLYCPGCGITRMLKSLFKFNVLEAFNYNQFVFVLMPFLFLLGINMIRRNLFNKKNFIPEKFEKVFWLVALVLALIFGILRNIPALDFLRP